jgi:hypothetical protein
MPTSNIKLTAISAREWTVRDDRIQNEDERPLIASIERIGGRYEVMTYGDPLSFSAFASLAAALESLTPAPPARADVSGTTRPVAVLPRRTAHVGRPLHHVG